MKLQNLILSAGRQVSLDKKANCENKNTANVNQNCTDLRGLQLMSELNKQLVNVTNMNKNVSFKAQDVEMTLEDRYRERVGRDFSCETERTLFSNLDKNTPNDIKNLKYDVKISGTNEFVSMPFSEILKLDKAYTLRISSKYLEDYKAGDKKEDKFGVSLERWFDTYKREANISTAGIRGNQSALYPWDTRNFINAIGIILATWGKSQVAKADHPNEELHKIATGEVRYNTDTYIDLIKRVQAANGIYTHESPYEDGQRTTLPVWLTSFLAFKLDMLGAEYVTSSHAIRLKTATKDINDQGSQYIPEESNKFVAQIENNVINKLKSSPNGYVDIEIAARDDKHIDTQLMKNINNGLDLYTQYLRDGIATPANINAIKNTENPMIIENVGGVAYRNLSKVLNNLEIGDNFRWLHPQEDPFFHNIGTGEKDGKFYDYTVDSSLVIVKDGKKSFPVLDTIDFAHTKMYDNKGKELVEFDVANKPVGTTILITDPDHDRLCIAQVEQDTPENRAKLDKLGIDYVCDTNKSLNGTGKILASYTPNQSFMLNMDFWMKQLKKDNLWDNHPRFIIKTTASAMSWDEWANANGVNVVNVPVGFKEIANIMKKVEKQIVENRAAFESKNYDKIKPIVIEDIYGSKIELSKGSKKVDGKIELEEPRMVFAGEESGGMIIGPEKLVESKAGRVAIAMREKSATESIIVSAALAASLPKNMSISDHLAGVFKENEIQGRYDVREDILYYNESETDPNIRDAAKKRGEYKRTKNDSFYLSMAIALKLGTMTQAQAKETLEDVFKGIDFSGLTKETMSKTIEEINAKKLSKEEMIDIFAANFGSKEVFEKLSDEQLNSIREILTDKYFNKIVSLDEAKDMLKDTSKFPSEIGSIFSNITIQNERNTIDKAIYDFDDKEQQYYAEILNNNIKSTNNVENDFRILDIDQINDLKAVFNKVLNDDVKLEDTITKLNNKYPKLDFSDLAEIKFVGDGTYLKFTDGGDPNGKLTQYVEIRPSGTDAKTKAYAAGSDKAKCLKFAQTMGYFSGNRTEMHKELIDKDYTLNNLRVFDKDGNATHIDKTFKGSQFYNDIKDTEMSLYNEWAMDGLPTKPFQIPDYKKTWANL